MRLTLALFLASCVFAQERQHIFEVIPNSTRSGVGQLWFLDKQTASHKITFQAPNTLAADINYVWNSADSAGCFNSNGSGTISILSNCGGPPFASNVDPTMDDTYNLGETAGPRWGIVAAYNGDFAPSGTTGNYLSTRKLQLTDLSGGTTFWYWQASGTSVNSVAELLDNAGNPSMLLERVISSTSVNRALVDFDWIPLTNTRTLGESGTPWANLYTVNATITGTCTGCGSPPFASNVDPTVDQTYNLGSASFRWGVLSAYNVDAAPAGQFGNYVATRKLQLDDNTGGTNFWYWQAAAQAANSYTTLTDNSGGTVIAFERVLSSVSFNRAVLDMDFVPSTNNTYALGSSGAQWANIYTASVIANGHAGISPGSALNFGSCAVTISGGIIYGFSGTC